MHELSIAESLVDVALDHLPPEPGVVRAVHLLLGELAGVEKEALLFGYDLVTQGTRLEGSRLVIEDVPVTLYCAACGAVVRPERPTRLRCERCHTPSSELRSGKELNLAALDFEPADGGAT